MKHRTYQNNVANHFREHSSIYLFVIVLFLMGVIFGAVVVNSLSFTQKEDLYYYLFQFFGQIADGKVAEENEMFIQSFLHNSKFIGLMWILGISIIGLPIILILLFIKGMVVGFTVGFLVNQMGWDGFLLSFVSILPQNLVIIPLFIVTATSAVAFSLKMIRRQFLKKISQPIMPMLGRYLLTFIMVMVFVGAAAAIEAFLSPILMKSVIQTIQSIIIIK
ncbi:stage II sporulation protein M [Bacillus canaveralius]|uniref:Stage II sporulation protein M n=1 Tax=Bacillus canaveralius TaxID=1403243 RepID=A0A2N5GRJ7_9BACI|nr:MULTISPECIES: stage II sporulation protein M [Bacillus]PLR84552.1 stage II sporulation protein M [Bacillus sp. V33-4]PLR86067.1 stage II sporulation protein M [Bacillus canaveralius]PLS00186.1 stage II sporulation protein M [Bacillus canaveralius]RSK52050.1 stage II sporulation protein M [Bacillus canaveralius]